MTFSKILSEFQVQKLIENYDFFQKRLFKPPEYTLIKGKYLCYDIFVKSKSKKDIAELTINGSQVISVPFKDLFLHAIDFCHDALHDCTIVMFLTDDGEQFFIRAERNPSNPSTTEAFSTLPTTTQYVIQELMLGRKQAEIAEKLGISQSAVSQIKNKKIQCLRCKQFKPLNEFGFRDMMNGKIAIQSYCNQCREK